MSDQIFLAKAGTVSESGVTLILPGQTAATAKSYKILQGVAVAAGDMVLCARVSGTYVILGVTAANPGT